MSEATTEQEQPTAEGTYTLDYETGTLLALDDHRDDLVARFAEKHPEADADAAELQVVSDDIGRSAKVRVSAPLKGKAKK